MYRGSVFIQLCNLVENGRLIVAKARHVELAGGTGVVSSSLYVTVQSHTHMAVQSVCIHTYNLCIQLRTYVHICIDNLAYAYSKQ